jgi:hypothetical protein
LADKSSLLLVLKNAQVKTLCPLLKVAYVSGALFSTASQMLMGLVYLFLSGMIENPRLSGGE